MFQAIHRADLCIADLSNNNPKVFYELAIAQGASRPVIILMKEVGLYGMRSYLLIYLSR
jgi:hypothetical protein